MPEEETGFTFVDKRRAASEAASESAAEAAAPQPASPDPAAEAEPDMDDGETPNVYGIIGYCISLLATQAWQNLGLLADPQTGDSVADLAQAKVAIDTVGDLAARLEAAPREAVPDALRRDLRTLVNDLRLNYVSQRGDNSASRN